MADLSKFNSDPQGQLMEQIKGSRCVMLGSTNASEHMQPMAPQIDTDLGHSIWFYSDNTSDLGKAVMANPGKVRMCYMDKDYQACVDGQLVVEEDRSKIDRFWGPIVSSWYPGGQADPKMLMLRFEPQDAAVWASTGNPLKFLYETAKANLTDSLPDVGKSGHVKMG